ncbi:MAG: response regulator transcription factor [Anaerovoracaceae bacterium]|jgi:two-component system copper resistance phosphate regulon response regulator CusR
MRILVVEDEKNLNRVLTRYLKKKGYNVDSCEDGISARDYISLGDYDTIILDIMLPGMNGIDLLSWARGEGIDSPVILLTARDSVEDKVRGLDSGADDYLTKPFAFEELMARIRVLTRKKAGNLTNEYSLGDLTVNSDTRQVTRGGVQISLSAKEFAMLEYMIANKGIVLSREKIEQNLWGYDYEGSSNMVDVYIRYLRKKIDEGHQNKLIHTVRGSGYVLKEGDR